jgi:hypothetical protein
MYRTLSPLITVAYSPTLQPCDAQFMPTEYYTLGVGNTIRFFVS